MLPLLTVTGLFVAAWLLARTSGRVARAVLTWHDRRTAESELGRRRSRRSSAARNLVALFQDGITIAGFVAAGCFRSR
jgi:hypothetical protein